MDNLLQTSALVEFERQYVRPRPGPTLVVGSKVYGVKEDRRKRYADATGVDMQAGEGVDLVQNLEYLLTEDQLLKFAHVDCMSVLEHCQRPWLVAQSIESMMLPGASIFVSVPFVWRVHGYPSDYWRMTPDALPILFPSIRWEKIALCSNVLDGMKAAKIYGYPYFPRTETAGFGIKV